MEKKLSRYAIINYSEKMILYDYEGKRVLKTIFFIAHDENTNNVKRLIRVCNLMNERDIEDLHYLENIKEYLDLDNSIGNEN